MAGITVGLVFDIVMLVILVIFLYKGASRGFSGEIIGLVGLFVSIFCAWKFLDPAIDLVLRYIPDTKIDRTVIALVCAVVIFFVVEIIFAIVGALLSYLVRVTQLSFTDHFFGMIIGLLKTMCIILFIYGVVSTFSHILPSDWIEGSYTMKGASYVWPPVRDFLQARGILDFKELTGGI